MHRRGFFIGITLFLTAFLLPSTLLAAETELHEAPVEIWMALPFVLLLAAIAVVPFISQHWWDKNYPTVTFVLGGIVLVLYLAVLGNSERVLHTAFEYFSFIVLIG
jgi:peptidoglycan/LPS O-acetylase OafA/YrhL